MHVGGHQLRGVPHGHMLQTVRHRMLSGMHADPLGPESSDRRLDRDAGSQLANSLYQNTETVENVVGESLAPGGRA